MRCLTSMSICFTIVGLLMPAQALADDEGDLNVAFDEAQKISKQGKLKEAALLYEKALRLAGTVYGENHEVTAAILSNLAILYMNQWKLAEAEPLYERCLSIREKLLGKEHADVADSLNILASLYVNRGKYAEAEPLYERCLSIREKLFGKEHSAIGQVLNNLAILYGQQGRYDEAEAHYLRSLSIREKLLGKEHPAVAASLNNLAVLCAKRDKDAEAESYFHRSLAIYEKVLGKENPTVADSLNNLALLDAKQGKFAVAEPHYRRSLSIREKLFGKENLEVAESLNNLALMFAKQRRYAEAEAHCLRSLGIREKVLGKEHLDVADSLNNLAILYVDQGRYVDAESLYQRSLRTRETVLGKGHPTVADSLNNLGILYRDQSRYIEAESHFQRSLAIYEKVHGKENRDVADSLNSLALLYAKQRKYAEAERLLQRSLSIREKVLGKDHPAVADSLNNLAMLYVGRGNYAEAEPLHQRSLSIREKAFGKDHPAVAATLNNLAILYREQGKYVEAKAHFQRCLAIYEKILGKDHPEIITVFGNLAMLYADSGNPAEALRLQTQLRHNSRQYLLRELPGLSVREQRAFLDLDEKDRFALALSLGYRPTADAADPSASWLANGKAIALESQAIRSRLNREVTDAAGKAILREIESLRSQEAFLALKSGSAKKLGPIVEQRERLEVSRRDLEKKLAQRGGTAAKLANPWVELADIRKSIPTDGILIDIARFNPYRYGVKPGEQRWDAARYVAWIIPAVGNGEVRIVDLGEAGPIDAAIRAAGRTIEETLRGLKLSNERTLETAASEKLAAVAKRVFEPLKPHLGGAKKLIVSPDGDLWLLPWAALPVGKDRYLIDDYSLRFVVSSRDLVEEHVGPKIATSPPLILADPDYDLTPAQVAEAAPKQVAQLPKPTTRALTQDSRALAQTAERLPNTVKEARQAFAKLQALTGREPKLYLQAEASEAIVKATKSPEVLVLATHGFFMKKQEVELKESRGIEQAGDKSQALTRDAEGQQIENPLLRCGLLLAGANKRKEAKDGEDDGILTGLEIIGLDLRGTRLVVLSACETGLGDIHTGEGVAGLRQAFQLAGAESVLATLWQIPDAATVELMSTFYDELAKGTDRAEALMKAQRQFLKERRVRKEATHPYFWAPFTSTGK